MNLDRQALAQRAAALAAQGVHVGTSSWKYPGWCGTLYDRSRYEYRGKFAETRFKRECLAGTRTCCPPKFITVVSKTWVALPSP